MAYHNRELCRRFEIKLGLSVCAAEQVFVDLKRFLYLCGNNDQPFSPPPKIDAAWHEFILYTEDYAEFCERMFGKFIHHRPKRYFGRPQPMSVQPILAKARKQFSQLSRNWGGKRRQKPSVCMI